MFTIEDLCNGSTPDSDSVCGGSNPSSSAKKKRPPFGWSFLFGAESDSNPSECDSPVGCRCSPAGRRTYHTICPKGKLAIESLIRRKSHPFGNVIQLVCHCEPVLNTLWHDCHRQSWNILIRCAEHHWCGNLLLNRGDSHASVRTGSE